MFKLEIDTSNDAFADSEWDELSMILKSLARKLESPLYQVRGAHINLYDRNGNKVGKAELTP